MKTTTPRRISFSLLLIAIVWATACGTEPPTIQPDDGEIRDGKYVNEFFGLSLTIPDGWAVASKETEQSMRDIGKENLSGDDPAREAALEVALRVTFQLLTISAFEMGAAVQVNPTLVLIAERVSHLPGIKSGKDYLFLLSNTLLGGPLPYELTKEPYPIRFAGEEFYRADFALNAPAMTLNQPHIVTIREGFALIVLLSGTDEYMAELEEIAASLKFD